MGTNSTQCCKSGHTVDVYYRTQSFPPNFKFRNLAATNNVVAKDVDAKKESWRQN